MNALDKIEQLYHTRWGRWGFLASNIILFLLLLATAYAQFQPIWEFYQQQEENAQTATSVKKPPSSIQLSRDIAREHLFGLAPIAESPAVVVTNIKVLGLFLADNPKQSSAVLVIDNQPEANFWVGDPLPGGGKVLEILADKVIISDNGQRKVIMFSMDEFSHVPDDINTIRAREREQANVPLPGNISPFDRMRPDWRERLRRRLGDLPNRRDSEQGGNQDEARRSTRHHKLG